MEGNSIGDKKLREFVEITQYLRRHLGDSVAFLDGQRSGTF
jgi:hypothetical protein